MAAILGGCAAPAWDGQVARWWTLREVLRDGDLRGRVRLDALGTGRTVGLGALEDLKGEITVIDGRIWTARADARGVIRTTSSPDAGDQAAFLAVADVPAWRDHPTDGPLDLAALETKLAALPGGRETVPFVVEGEIAELDAHVLNGACPFAADPARRGEPVRFRREKAPGRVVGFFTTLPAGTLTHHGSRLHVHVLLDEGPMTGHVDRMVIEGTLRVPAP